MCRNYGESLVCNSLMISRMVFFKLSLFFDLLICRDLPPFRRLTCQMSILSIFQKRKWLALVDCSSTFSVSILSVWLLLFLYTIEFCGCSFHHFLIFLVHMVMLLMWDFLFSEMVFYHYKLPQKCLLFLSLIDFGSSCFHFLLLPDNIWVPFCFFRLWPIV